MDNWFDSQGHMTEKGLHEFIDATLPEDVLTASAEHVASCEHCAFRMASVFDNAADIPVPTGFAEQTMHRAASSEQRQNSSFALYILKVAVAAGIALTITFSGTFTQLANGKTIAEPKAPGNSFVNSVSSGLNSFSQFILNIGSVNNAQKKK